MKKIGIIAVYKQENVDKINRVAFDYVQSVEDAGGIVYIIPCNSQHIDHFVKELDGFVLPGADEDVTPSLYGEKNEGAHGCIIENDHFLLDLVDKLYQANKPILAICKGHQIINTYFGGTLIQAMDDNGEHLQRDKQHKMVHNISVMDNSFLYNVFQAKQIQVNSIHHQAIKTLGNNLISTGMSEDGYIEAIEHKDKKIYGFQWHPECLGDHLPIFKKFIEKI